LQITRIDDKSVDGVQKGPYNPLWRTRHPYFTRCSFRALHYLYIDLRKIFILIAQGTIPRVLLLAPAPPESWSATRYLVRCAL